MTPLIEYIKRVQEEGAEDWAERFREEYGISIDDMQEAAVRELVPLNRAIRSDSREEQLIVAMVGGIFLGMAAMIMYQKDFNDLAEELDNYGKENKNDSGS